MDKNKLEIGHLIKFHSWGVGGFLFGVIIKHEDELYHSKLNIWRPKNIYMLQDSGIDAIKLIESVQDIEDYELHDFLDLIDEIKQENIYCKLKVK